MPEAHTFLLPWESFYVIVGSSGAALTGLQFVVVALITETTRRNTSREMAAFSTPTVIHFCAVLLMAAILSAPWHELSNVALVLGACGVVGLAYCAITFRRALRTTEYKPVLSDWIWHTILPAIAYASLLLGALMLPRFPERTLFLIAASALLLLFIGIHNAWDTATYLVMHVIPKEKKKK
jgi:amino acid transporter